MTRCSICHTLIQATDASVACDSCRQAYHATCWKDLGGCATYGCPKAPATNKPPPPVAAGMGWGDEKKCPACSRTIASGDLFCRCGAQFPYADPMTAAEYAAFRERRSVARKRRQLIVILFIVSLAGFTAPVTGALAGFIAWTNRKELSGADGTYEAMGYGAAALGATYGVLLLLLAAGA